RRRHTRFSRDWSSDVCSSDLVLVQNVVELVRGGLHPGEGIRHGVEATLSLGRINGDTPLKVQSFVSHQSLLNSKLLPPILSGREQFLFGLSLFLVELLSGGEVAAVVGLHSGVVILTGVQLTLGLLIRLLLLLQFRRDIALRLSNPDS